MTILNVLAAFTTVVFVVALTTGSLARAAQAPGPGRLSRARWLAATAGAVWFSNLGVTPALAQDAASAAECALLPAQRQSARPSVKSVYRLQANDGSSEPLRKDDARLGDEISIEVNNLQTLLLERACEASSGTAKKIVLYLDDRPMVDVEAYPPQDPDSGRVKFQLRRTEASRAAWTHLLGKPSWDPRPVKVSLGLQDRYGIASTAVLKLRVLPHPQFIGWTLLIALLMGSLFFIPGWSHVLRDTNSKVSGGAKPWSLSRVQAAWWFFLILASYVLIGLVTGDYSTSITGTVLVLLGIASGTTAVSTVIDRSKDTPALAAAEQAAIAQLTADIAGLNAALGALAAHPGKTLAQLQAEKAAKESQLRKLNYESENFFVDILSDANGVSLHRFQVAAWTLVLGIVFVMEVYHELAMPQFDETLLLLMGLSAGTFVAMKSTEADVPKS